MERMTKVVLSIVFPGIIGFFAACILILPQLILRGMQFEQSLAVGVLLSGACSALCAKALRSRIRSDKAALGERQVIAVPAE